MQLTVVEVPVPSRHIIHNPEHLNPKSPNPEAVATVHVRLAPKTFKSEPNFQFSDPTFTFSWLPTFQNFTTVQGCFRVEVGLQILGV